MNRKQFFQLLALLPASLLTKGNTMFPKISTNKYGDMLEEFYHGMKNGTLSESRLNDIVRRFNEFSDREERYKATIQTGTGRPKLDNPVITNPLFSGDALSALTLNRTTDVSITQDQDIPIEWESSYGSSQAFSWNVADPQKIRVKTPGSGFCVAGRVAWAANATGYRNVKIAHYDNSNTLIASIALHEFKGFSEGDNIFPFIAVIPYNIIPEMTYFKITVAQGSGAGLNLIFADLHLFVT